MGLAHTLITPRLYLLLDCLDLLFGESIQNLGYCVWGKLLFALQSLLVAMCDTIANWSITMLSLPSILSLCSSQNKANKLFPRCKSWGRVKRLHSLSIKLFHSHSLLSCFQVPSQPQHREYRIQKLSAGFIRRHAWVSSVFANTRLWLHFSLFSFHHSQTYQQRTQRHILLNCKTIPKIIVPLKSEVVKLQIKCNWRSLEDAVGSLGEWKKIYWVIWWILEQVHDGAWEEK